MDEVQKSTLLTSLPGDSVHTDFGESPLQKEEVRTGPIVPPPGSVAKPLALEPRAPVIWEATAKAPEQDACDECHT